MSRPGPCFSFSPIRMYETQGHLVPFSGPPWDQHTGPAGLSSATKVALSRHVYLDAAASGDL